MSKVEINVPENAHGNVHLDPYTKTTLHISAGAFISADGTALLGGPPDDSLTPVYRFKVPTNQIENYSIRDEVCFPDSITGNPRHYFSLYEKDENGKEKRISLLKTDSSLSAHSKMYKTSTGIVFEYFMQIETPDGKIHRVEKLGKSIGGGVIEKTTADKLDDKIRFGHEMSKIEVPKEMAQILGDALKANAPPNPAQMHALQEALKAAQEERENTVNKQEWRQGPLSSAQQKALDQAARDAVAAKDKGQSP